MLSRDRFRQNHVIPTRPRRPGARLIAAALVLALLGLLWGGWQEAANPAANPAVNQRHSGAGAAADLQSREHLERAALREMVKAAYEQGLADATAAARETPGGIALAQACLAMKGRP